MSSSLSIARDVQRQRTSLVAVRGLSETVAAGCGNAMLLVRTLDDVSLDLCGGDLVLLSGRVGEGAASLAGALAGRRRIVHGARELHPGVRVRRGTVVSGAGRAIVDGWAVGLATRCTREHAAGVRTVYILRVRRSAAGCAHVGTTDSSGDAHTRASRSAHYPSGAWFGWARALCERGGAVVLWDVDERRGRPATGGAVHEQNAEGVLPYGIGGPDDARGAAARPGRLRSVSLVAGRLVSTVAAASATLPPPVRMPKGSS